MAKDSFALKLNGTVALPVFSKVIKHFTELTEALAEEVVERNTKVEWEIANLEFGSALIAVRPTIQGQSLPIETGRKLNHTYETLGRGLAEDGNSSNITLSNRVIDPAISITKIINKNIDSVEFVAESGLHYIIEKPIKELPDTRRYSVGIIKGLVSSISVKKNAKLFVTLYDNLFNKSVYCQLNTGQEELARQVWRKQVAITGLVYRNPATGQPIQMKQIIKVEILEEKIPGSFLAARGALAWKEGDEPAEVSIRRLRDAVLSLN